MGLASNWDPIACLQNQMTYLKYSIGVGSSYDARLESYLTSNENKLKIWSSSHQLVQYSYMTKNNIN